MKVEANCFNEYITDVTLKLTPSETLIIAAALYDIKNNISRNSLDREKAQQMLEEIRRKVGRYE